MLKILFALFKLVKSSISSAFIFVLFLLSKPVPKTPSITIVFSSTQANALEKLRKLTLAKLAELPPSLAETTPSSFFLIVSTRTSFEAWIRVFVRP
jgi:hypothetical protein